MSIMKDLSIAHYKVNPGLDQHVKTFAGLFTIIAAFYFLPCFVAKGGFSRKSDTSR